MSNEREVAQRAISQLHAAARELDDAGLELSNRLNQEPDHSDVFASAIQDGYVVEFDYSTKDEPLETIHRTFSPFELSEDWVLGFDHDRDAIRRFRLDRIFGSVELSPGAEYVRPG